MDKLLIRQDWANHFVYGAVFTKAAQILVLLLAFQFPHLSTPEIVRWVPVGAGVALAAGKELIYDKWMGRGEPTWEDFLWTVAGVSMANSITV
jgi:hypothetical protein